MEHLEVIIYDEINDYKEKIKGLTFRQWVFVVIGLALVIPTYIFLPKYTPINKDITSYIVMVEAAIIGFFGFIKIQGLNAEKIIPYWYRHYICYGKPMKYITDAEWEEMHQSKKQKAAKQKETKEEQQKTTQIQKEDVSSKLSKKELKKQKKQQQMLERAKAKYGFMLEDEQINSSNSEPTPVQNNLSIEQVETKLPTAEIEPVATNDKKTSINNVGTENNTADELIRSLSPEEKAVLIAKLMEK